MIGSISSTALSGMAASSRRLDVSASNTANAQSTGRLPGAAAPATAAGQAYQPRQVVQSSVPTGGTVTGVRPTTPGYVPQYAPDSPDADADGLVAAPDVDMAQEVTAQISAKSAYAFNLRAFEASDEMTRRLLDVKS